VPAMVAMGGRLIITGILSTPAITVRFV